MGEQYPHYIEFRHLSFSYNGTQVLKDINLKIPAGSSLAMVVSPGKVVSSAPCAQPSLSASSGVSPLSSRPSCPVSGKTVKVAVRKTISATARLACTAGQAARFTSLTGNEQAVLPVPRPLATAIPPGAC